MHELDDNDEDTGAPVHRLIFIVVVTAMVLLMTGTAWASKWVPTLRAYSSGEARAQDVPAAPTGVAAVCTSSAAKSVKVSWTAAPRATSYTVYEATTSAGTYSSVATGVPTASWTSGALTATNYWFKVGADIGINWLGANSSATGETTISSSGCVQP